MSDFSTQTIKGYHLLERIGEGAYGAVYRATQTQVQREVALKVILPEHANRPDFIRRFETEAHLVAQLEHLHIVPLYDYWREPDGAYLVMRLMKGGSLADLLENGPVGLDETARLLEQVASALEAAHRKGVVHRDLKPANILLDEEGNAYLSDFGIAKDLGRAAGVTQTGAIVGSPAYISPEQVQSGEITPQTDIYALGVVLFEMLAGGHPFPDTPVGELVVRHLRDPLPSILEKRPDLSKGLDAVLQRATAKNSAERYPDALALVNDLRLAIGDDGSEILISEDVELTNPYKGLRAFQEADAADFFGREALTGLLLSRLAEPVDFNHFLAVVGPSGSGKSSVVKAGLLPALRSGALAGSEAWFVVEMTPGKDPFAELAQGLEKVAINRRSGLAADLRKDEEGLMQAVRLCLPSDNDTLLLVIDQFEEVFTLLENQDEARHFLDSLYAAVTDPRSPVRVVVTLRADFYDRPLMHPDFSALMQKRTQVVVPMTAEELGQAVRGPAEGAGAIFEPGLEAEIVADVVEQPGALPLLQYALTELFEQREGRTLTRTAYRKIGGVLGALGKRAEEVYGGLDEAEQELARQLFLRLVTFGEGKEDTRRRVLKTELEGLKPPGEAKQGAYHPPTLRDRDNEPVIDAFGGARLLSFDRDPVTRGPTVEVAHEALLREWPRLRGWLESSRTEVRMSRLLGAAAGEWAMAGKDSSFLLRGSRLDQFEGWAQETSLALTTEERDFLEASLQERRQREAEEAARQERERLLEQRSLRRLRIIVAVLVAASIFGIALTAAVFRQSQVARRNEAAALNNAATATVAQGEALNQAAIAATNAALAEAEANIRTTQQALAEQARSEAELQAQLAFARELAAAANNLEETQPDLSLLLALQSASVGLEAVQSIPIETEDALHRALAVAPPRLISTEPNSWVFFATAFNPNGTRLAAVGEPFGQVEFRQDRLVIFDITPGKKIELLMDFQRHASPINDVAYSPDGSLLGIASSDRTARIWDAATGEEQMTLRGHVDSVVSLSFHPDGVRLATASLDGTVKVWDLSTGEVLMSLAVSENGLKKALYTREGSKLITTAIRDSAAILWDANTGEKQAALQGHTASIADLAVSPDGAHLATFGEDAAVIVWDLPAGELSFSSCCYFNPAGLGAPLQSGLNHGVFSPDGDFLVFAIGGRRIIALDVQGKSPGQVRYTIQRGGQPINWSYLAFNPDGMRLFQYQYQYSGGIPLSASLSTIDFSIGRERTPLSGFRDSVLAVAYHPDGNRLATADAGGSVKFWEFLGDGEQVRKIPALPGDPHSRGVNDLAFHPSGNALATAGNDRLVKVWEISAGEASEAHTLSGHIGGVHALVYHPDGSQLASASADQNAIIWDLDSGEQLNVLRGHSSDVLDVAYSPDGALLATASADQTVRIWNTQNGGSRLTLRRHEEEVRSVAFSPDGTQILSGDANGTAILWELASGEAIFTMDGHTGAVNRAVFTPDGQRIITTGDDGTSKVWEVATGRELFTLSGHDGPVLDLALSPDGSLMATASADKTVNFYILDTDVLVAYAESLITRWFTDEECRQFLHAEVCPPSFQPGDTN